MKRQLLLTALAISIPLIFLSSFYAPQGDEEPAEYIIVGWNDLGMHCSNLNFDSIIILPPYNNLRAQVIKVGNATTNPEIITTGVSVGYEIPGNTYSVGKTDFWDHEYEIFGVELDDNIGLTGAGLTGEMNGSSDHFGIDGVPITPYTDADLENEDPFQLALLTAYDVNNFPLASTQPVIPVSNEIGCVSSGCHSSQEDILDEHTDDMGFDPTAVPILCATCHADVALGMPGVEGVESLSYVMHEKHKGKTNDCYKCHPGENTQCFRGVMHDAGMVCADCHGGMKQVAESISEGRQPWLQEPSCGSTSCHGSNYAEEPGKLYKDSKGHGGLYCSACHGSTHAIAPSTEARDNVQNIALQGHAGALDDCTVCHGVNPTGAGPHGIMAPTGNNDATLSDLLVNGTTIDGFNPTLLNYVYELNNGETTVPLVTATAADPNANVDVTPAGSVPGTTDVLVTAEDNVTSILYTVEFVLGTEVAQIVEPFETGVPVNYYNGRIDLPSGRWNVFKAKENLNGYSGKAIQLRGGHTSYIVTPKLIGCGTVEFYFKGDGSEPGVFKFQKKIGTAGWQTIEEVSYDNSGWQFYSAALTETYPNVKIRIRKGSGETANLLIDDFYVAEYNPAANSMENQEMVDRNDENSEKSASIGVDELPIDIYSYQGMIRVNIPESLQETGTIAVFDLSGRQIYQAPFSGSGTQSIKGINHTGFYIVHVTTNSHQKIEKVFVK